MGKSDRADDRSGEKYGSNQKVLAEIVIARQLLETGKDEDCRERAKEELEQLQPRREQL